jgi:CheY-like chemotaxis protein
MEKRILIVEDDSDTSDLISNLLARYRYTITVVDTGQKAIDICKKSVFDLILMDLMLPDIHGLIVIKEIKKMPKFKKVPILAITAASPKEFMDKVLEAGGQDLLNKPFTPFELIKLVDQYLKIS